MTESSTAQPKPLARKPSTAFLIVLNLGAYLVLAALSVQLWNPFVVMLFLVGTGVFVIVSVVWQLVWWMLNRQRRFHNVTRCVGYLLPIIALLLIGILSPDRSRPVNKQYPAISQHGQYQAYVDTNAAGWVIEIKEGAGAVVYHEQTDMVPFLNVYWMWGAGDRLWLYNSDDGQLHCWFKPSEGQWQHTLVSKDGPNPNGITPADIPAALLPDYAAAFYASPVGQ